MNVKLKISSKSMSSILSPFKRRLLQTTYVHENHTRRAASSERNESAMHNFRSIPVHQSTPATIQTKLTVNEPGDKYEQEADRVADEVMRMQVPPGAEVEGLGSFGFGPAPQIQRKCAACEDEDEVQRMPDEDDDELHRMPEQDDNEELQAKEQIGKAPKVAPQTQAQIESLRNRGEPMSTPVRSFFESRFGVDFGKIRIHASRQAADSARDLNARAFTKGSDIVFAAGQYNPETTEGRKLIAHELTHTLQQKSAFAPVSAGSFNSTFPNLNPPSQTIAFDRSSPNSYPRQTSNATVRRSDRPIDRMQFANESLAALDVGLEEDGVETKTKPMVKQLASQPPSDSPQIQPGSCDSQIQRAPLTTEGQPSESHAEGKEILKALLDIPLEQAKDTISSFSDIELLFGIMREMASLQAGTSEAAEKLSALYFVVSTQINRVRKANETLSGEEQSRRDLVEQLKEFSEIAPDPYGGGPPPSPGNIFGAAGSILLGPVATGLTQVPSALTQVIQQAGKSGSAFFLGLEKGLNESSLTDQQKEALIQNAYLSSPLFPAVYAGITVGIAQDAIETLASLPDLPEAIKAAFELADMLLTPGGEQIAAALGQELGRSLKSDIAKLAAMSAPEFAFEVGKKVGPILAGIVLSFAGGVGAGALAARFIDRISDILGKSKYGQILLARLRKAGKSGNKTNDTKKATSSETTDVDAAISAGIISQAEVSGLRRVMQQLREAIPEGPARDRNTVAVAIIEIDGDRAFAFSMNRNKFSDKKLSGEPHAINQLAEELGVLRIDAEPRTRTRTKKERATAAAPEDAEQLLLEGAFANNIDVIAIMPSRIACAACATVIPGEGVLLIPPPWTE